jgi:hypothetical protein
VNRPLPGKQSAWETRAGRKAFDRYRKGLKAAF